MADIKQIQLSGSELPLDIKDQTARDWIAGAIDLFYPIGSVIINLGADPSDYLTGTTWVRTAVGKAIVGVDSTNALMDTAGETFGQADSIVPSHTHSQEAHSHTVNSHSHTVNSHSHTVNSHTHGPGSLSGYYRGRGEDNSGSGYGGCIHYAFSGGFNASSSGGGVILNSGATGASAPGTSASAPGTSAVSPGTSSVTPAITSTGETVTNKNYQPSMAFYIWERTA